jgi:glycosyltransferase involved in cell wall biosynthesis
VVYPRRAMANANYRGFVEAAIELSSESDAQFVGVGLRSAEAELTEAFGSAVEAVELTGQLGREEMASLLRRAQIVVSPTYWDGTPISVLEAIACGAKVIAGRLPELVRLQEGGMDIQLIDPSTTSSIADAIREALVSGAFGDGSTLPVEFNRVANQDRVVEFYSRVLSAGF